MTNFIQFHTKGTFVNREGMFREEILASTYISNYQKESNILLRRVRKYFSFTGILSDDDSTLYSNTYRFLLWKISTTNKTPFYFFASNFSELKYTIDTTVAQGQDFTLELVKVVDLSLPFPLRAFAYNKALRILRGSSLSTHHVDGATPIIDKTLLKDWLSNFFSSIHGTEISQLPLEEQARLFYLPPSNKSPKRFSPFIEGVVEVPTPSTGRLLYNVDTKSLTFPIGGEYLRAHFRYLTRFPNDCSRLAIYSLEKSNYRAIYLKPFGIDRVVISFPSSFDIFITCHKRKKQPTFYKMQDTDFQTYNKSYKEINLCTLPCFYKKKTFLITFSFYNNGVFSQEFPFVLRKYFFRPVKESFWLLEVGK